jgi:hypothetical protein
MQCVRLSVGSLLPWGRCRPCDRAFAVPWPDVSYAPPRWRCEGGVLGSVTHGDVWLRSVLLVSVDVGQYVFV